MEKLRLKQEAVKATAAADTDRRLRRALLRKFMGQQTILTTRATILLLLERCPCWKQCQASLARPFRGHHEGGRSNWAQL